MIESCVTANRSEKAQKGGDDRGNSIAILEIEDAFLVEGRVVLIPLNINPHLKGGNKDVYA
jgi:hypothetical protein